MVVSAKLKSTPILESIDTSTWKKYIEGGRIEVTHELNGSVTEFGAKLRATIDAQSPLISQKLSSSKLKSVNYTDRYIQSPWSIILLGEVIRGLVGKNSVSSTITTQFAEKDRTGRKLHHDWDSKDEFESVADLWFDKGLKLPVKFIVENSKSKVPHRRELLLKFEDGEQFSIAFDQGVGYWSHQVSKDWFNFHEVEEQLLQMVEVWKSGSVRNSADWPSVLYINKI